MTFDSTTFLVFFFAFFALYWSCARNLAVQNALILAGSYLFYGWWDWRFLALIVVSSATDYFAAMAMARQSGKARRRALLLVSLGVNLSVLGVFKYFNFFADSLVDLASLVDIELHPVTTRFILPVGISFYTFQSMSYTIDVYRNHQAVERNPLTFFCFVAFFPQLVAGPIERASHLIPQFKSPRSVKVDFFREGFWLVVYGLFLKEVIADNVAQIADLAFDVDQRSGWMVIIGSIAFSIQIYSDFLGYSLVARGIARLLGFDLRWNFNRPYFATSLSDFWHRWHMSLSEWLRDYVYISLGGNRRGRLLTYRNLMTTMLLGGLWHGAAWNFVFWGALHGGALCLERAFRGKPSAPPSHTVLGRVLTLGVVVVGWFVFRCDSLAMMSAMGSALGDMSWRPIFSSYVGTLGLLAAPLVLHEFVQHVADDQLVVLRLRESAFAVLAGCMIAVVTIFFERFDIAFVYFQF